MTEGSSGPARRRVRAIGTQSTVDHVDSEIRRAFLAGVLRPGEEFSMAELSAQLQVSHVPVREALRRLEAQGLVILRPGRSAVIAPLDAEGVEDVYRLWILLSNEVIVRACIRYTEADIEAIEAALDAFTALPQDSDEAFDAHYRFHRLLLAPGASTWDLRLLDILWPVIERAARLAYRTIIGQSDGGEDPRKRAHAEHRPLVTAARARDVTRLQRELRAHHEGHMRLVVACLVPLDISVAGDVIGSNPAIDGEENGHGDDAE
jgi:DNA-binding GntR family transcriptional regulator